MKKILLPIDGSPRSARTIDMLKRSYKPEEAEVTLVMVEFKDERVEMSKIFEKYTEDAKHSLDDLAKSLEGYTVHTKLLFGTDGGGMPEPVWLGAVHAKQALSPILTEWMGRGWVDAAEAINIAEQLLYKNALSLYPSLRI